MSCQSINPNDGKTSKTLEHFNQLQFEKPLATVDDLAELANMKMGSFADLFLSN